MSFKNKYIPQKYKIIFPHQPRSENFDVWALNISKMKIFIYIDNVMTVIQMPELKKKRLLTLLGASGFERNHF